MPLQLYANLVSQPSRAVAWILKIKGVEHEFVNVDLGSAMLKSKEFLAMNPNGLVPVLKDDEFSLFEGNAILTYLTEKFEWEDLYPRNLQTRAKINEYLHWHHATVRTFTTQIVRPYFKRQIKIATPEDLAHIGQTQEIIKKHLSVLEKFFHNDFVARTHSPTVADFALYCEMDQLEAMALLDLIAYPKIEAWFERMKKLPYHDEIHVVMNGFMRTFGLAGVGKKDEEP